VVRQVHRDIQANDEAAGGAESRESGGRNQGSQMSDVPPTSGSGRTTAWQADAREGARRGEFVCWRTG
jgi:hypothetical protein